MLKGNKHIVNTAGLLVLAGTIFCILFGQGTHLHDLDIHISTHLDVHFHLHAHESEDVPLQADHNQESNSHRHEVSTASDIIGTLTTPLQVKPDVKKYTVGFFYINIKLVNKKFDETPTLFDLPPPRPTSSQYHLSSFSHRGPPVA